MRVAVLFSGGKDSTMALFESVGSGYDIRYLVTMFPARSDSWMFHHPCIELTKLQAQAIGIKHIVQKTSGEKEKELKDLTLVLRKISGEIDGVVSGAVASKYQKDRIDSVCEKIGLKSITPLWGMDQMELLADEVRTGFKIIITGVAAEGFDEDWLGRRIDKQTLVELKQLNKKFGINPAGEGGEYETFVIDGPIFKQRIELGDMEKIWDKKTNSGYIICKNAKLVNK